MANCKPTATPAIPMDLSKGQPDPKFPVRQCVGALQFVASLARPDIAWSVQRAACNMHAPTSNLVASLKRIIQYLRGTKSFKLEYSPKNERNFQKVFKFFTDAHKKELGKTVAFSDADFAGCTTTLKSTSGSILYHRGTAVVWSSRRQTLRAMSTCESEYIALFDTIRMSQSCGWLDWFIQNKEIPTTFTDNRSAIDLSAAEMVTKRSKHIDLRFHMVRDHAKDLCHCSTIVNRADPFTKPLTSEKYISLFKADPRELYEVVNSKSSMYGKPDQKVKPQVKTKKAKFAPDAYSFPK